MLETWPVFMNIVKLIDKSTILSCRRDGYGLSLRNSKPLCIETVSKNSPAYEAGICSGDMIIQVNGQYVKRLSKHDVDKLIERSADSIKLKLIVGNSAIENFKDKYSSKAASFPKKMKEFLEQVSINNLLQGFP